MIFLDTNVLIYAHNSDDKYHEKAQLILAEIFEGKSIQSCLSPQVLLEFSNTITNPLKVKKPLSVAEAAAALEDFWNSSAIKKIFPPTDLFPDLIDLIRTLRLTGSQVFDAHIYLTMKANNIHSIMTANVKDFRRFHIKQIINPFE